MKARLGAEAWEAAWIEAEASFVLYKLKIVFLENKVLSLCPKKRTATLPNVRCSACSRDTHSPRLRNGTGSAGAVQAHPRTPSCSS